MPVLRAVSATANLAAIDNAWSFPKQVMRDQMLISRTRKVAKVEHHHDFELFSKSAKMPEVSANTLDNRRNCRHTHLLGAMNHLSRDACFR
jgi:hypothetical protein